MTRKRLPKYVSEFRDRHGKWHVRFRKKGQASYYFKNQPWSDAFMQEYQACLSGKNAPKIQPGRARMVPGSISSLIVAYYCSPDFSNLSDTTKTTYRGIIERFREQHGDKLVRNLKRPHIQALVSAKAKTPAAANNLLRMLRTLMRYAVDIGWRQDDPALKVKGFKIKSRGFHTWTEEEISQFEAYFQVGSQERLALALLLYSAQRRSDVVRMGRQHIKSGSLHIRQQKTGMKLVIPVHEELRDILEASKTGDMTFLITKYGKPRTPAGFGNWFSESARKAGLPKGCSAHGLRKAACRRLAEAGCTPNQIMSISGHKTLKEVSRYTQAVNKTRLASDAITGLSSPNKEQKMSNLPKKLDNSNCN